MFVYINRLNKLWIGSGLVLLVGLLLYSGHGIPAAVSLWADSEAEEIGDVRTAAPSTSEQAQKAGEIYLPIAIDQPLLADRMGYGITTPAGGSSDITLFPVAEELHAGWYLDWKVNTDPVRPQNIEYAQLIRVHQRLSCGQRYHADREECPYVEPYNQQDSYNYWPSAAVITATAIANPGSLWLIGNEMERRDWLTCVQYSEVNPAECTETRHTGQDEILPITYAVAYNELYHLIKGADPTAQVAVGGVIQPTPLRLEYLTQIWDWYIALFGEEMPVDVWNIHNFIMREERNGWGADIPAGLPDTTGEYLSDSSLHVDIETFIQQIVDFRTWMAAHGEQNRPLIVSEYGVLLQNSQMGLAPEDAEAIHQFMLDTFTYFLTTKDCELGYLADDCRLVQRWNWYSLENRFAYVNPYSTLVDAETGELSAAGEKFREFALENWHELALPE